MVIYSKNAYSSYIYNVYLELMVAFWLVSPSFVLCLNLHTSPTQQVEAYW